ncbi:MAG: cytochrome c [Alphaproteobacteria bacterium]|nr:cytochrome c [Alphaproteobacteria bacterium]
MHVLRLALPTVAVAVVVACGPAREPDAALALTGDVARGQAQYQMVCARCHGANGFGMLQTPALAYTVSSHDDRTVVSAMIRGRGGMGAQDVTDQQAADILAWLRATWPTPEAAKTPPVATPPP